MDPSAESWPNSQQQWQDNPIYDITTEISSLQQLLNLTTETQSFLPSNPNDQTQMTDQTVQIQDWDPTAMLNNLSFLEQNIHQLQNVVHLIAGRTYQVDELEIQKQKQLLTTDVTSIIVHLISTAGSLLQHSQSTLITPAPPMNVVAADDPSNHRETEDDEGIEKEGGGEIFRMGVFVILQLEKEELLAPHAHHCVVCGRGFKRDANRRMHMRGHGDRYKTAAALAKPKPPPGAGRGHLTRYSCPVQGCKRNKEHKKFQPLKTVLCAKNHYKRAHCEKSFVCGKCETKKFSIVADLKTHEKHCGRDKWVCSCGSTFSRKDKLMGHITLFKGHNPAENEVANKVWDVNGDANMMDVNVKESAENIGSCFSPLDFGTCDFGGFSGFSDDTECSF